MKNKKERKKKRNIGKGILLAILLNIMFLSPGEDVLKANAEGLEQSEEQVSITLQHEHTQETCYERTWIPCGGSWRTNMEPSVGALVYYCTNGSSSKIVNGVRLSSIHSGWYYDERTGTHSGEYRNVVTCDTAEIGTFSITRQEGEDGVTLNMVLETENPLSYEIWINGELQENENPSYPLTQNGTNDIRFRWLDEITNEWKEETMTYTDVSLPITLSFCSGGEVLEEYVLHYGEELPEIVPPEQTGYEFGGYYYEDVLFYDENGAVTEQANSLFLATTQSMEASWEAKRYVVRYGEDLDEDGVPDQTLEVTYGESYESILPPESENGKRFDGYYIGDERVFDAEGNPTGMWRWDTEGELALEAVYVSPHSSGNNQGGDSEQNSTTEDNQTQIIPSSEATNQMEEEQPCISEEAAVSENSISGNSISSNSISENEIHHPGNGGNEKQSNERNEGDTGSEGDLLNGNLTNQNYDYESENDTQGEGEHRLGEGASDVQTEQTQDSVMEEEKINVELPNYAEGANPRTLGILNRENLPQTVAVATSTLIMGVGLWTAVYYLFLFRFALLYDGEGSKKKKIGRLWIGRKEDGFLLTIPEKWLDAMEGRHAEIEFSDAFMSKNTNKDLLIRLPDKTLEESVQKGLCVRVL